MQSKDAFNDRIRTKQNENSNNEYPRWAGSSEDWKCLEISCSCDATIAGGWSTWIRYLDWLGKLTCFEWLESKLDVQLNDFLAKENRTANEKWQHRSSKSRSRRLDRKQLVSAYWPPLRLKFNWVKQQRLGKSFCNQFPSRNDVY